MIEGLLTSEGFEKLVQATAVGILGSFIPICRKVANAIIKFLEERQNDSASLAVLSSALAASMARTPFDRNVMLMIEDNRIDAYQLQMVCDEALHEVQYTTVITPTLQCAYKYQNQARVIVIDVGLPDASELLVKRFVAEIGPMIPTVIWSANEYTKEQFPSAYAIKKKTDQIDSVVATIKAALAEPRRV